MLTDAQLLNRYIEEHSSEAFAAIVSRHLDGVYSAALRRVGGDAHLAEDVSQHVFIALARQAKTLSTHPALVAWLHRTTRNEAANTVRRERRRKTRETESSLMHENDSGADSLDWSRLAPVLDEAIDKLGETDRTALLLRYVDRRPFAEIGTILALNKDAARMRVERALDKLRALLGKRGITSTSVALSLVLANNAVATAPASVATHVTLAAIETTPATIVATQIGSGILVSTKAYVGFAALVAASLSYFVFTRAPEKVPSPFPSPVAAESKPSQHVWPAEEVAARDFLDRHPDVQQALRAFYRAEFITKYGYICRELQLSPVETEQLQALYGESKFYQSPAMPGLILPGGSGLSKAEAQTRRDSLLGERRYAIWNWHVRNSSVRRRAEEIASELVFSNSMLTHAQISGLMQLLKQAGYPRDWETLISQARSIFSPRQIDALLVLRTEDRLHSLRRQRGSAPETLRDPAQTLPSDIPDATLEKLQLNDPQVLAAWREKQHASLARDYAPFYERAGLSAEERKALEKIFIERTLRSLKRMPRLAHQEITSAQTSLLGAARFQLNSFERSKRFYALTTTFGAHAALAGHALTFVQAEKLAQTLLAKTPVTSTGGRLLHKIDWLAVDAAAAEFLSPEQLELLRSSDMPSFPRFRYPLDDAIRAALEKDRQRDAPTLGVSIKT